MPQTVLNDVVQGWNGLFITTIERLEARLRGKLASIGVDPDDVEGLTEVFSDLPHPFEGLETCYKQENYFREKMKLVVSIFFFDRVQSDGDRFYV